MRTRSRTLLATLTMILLGLTAGTAVGSAAALAHPDGAGSVGVVTIFANGTVSPNAGPLLRLSGSTYTLTGELNGSLVVLASDVTVDGAGFLVNYTVGEPGGDNAALTVARASDVIVENFRTANASIGVRVNATTSVTVAHNVLVGTVRGVDVGNSSGPVVTGNAANATTQAGVHLDNVTYASVTGNRVENASTGTGAFAVFATGCAYLTVSANDGNGSYNGFEALYSHDLRFSGNNISFSGSGDGGIGVYADQNAVVTGNSAFDSATGVWSEDASNVTISDNWLPHDGTPVRDRYDAGLTASGNYAVASSSTGIGIDSEHSQDVAFLANNLSGAQDEGVYLDEDSNATVAGNDLSDFYAYGVHVVDAYGATTVTGNNLTGGTATFPYGVYVSGAYGPTTIANNSMPGLYEGVYAVDGHGDLVVTGNDLAHAGYAGVESDYQYGGSLEVANNLIGGTEYGVYDSEFDYGYVPVTVTGNDLSNATADAVYLYEPNGPVVISGNRMTDAYQGVESDSPYGGSLTLTNNRMENETNGLYVDAYDNGWDPVTVAGNLIPNASSYAVYLYEQLGNVLVTGNNLSGSLEGVESDYAYGGYLNVSNNSIVHTRWGVYDDADAYGWSPLTVAGNNISDAVYEAVYGYYVEGPIAITGNDLANDASDAIDLTYSNYAGTTIAGNDLANTQGDAVYVYEGRNVTVSDNVAPNATSYGVALTADAGRDTIVDNQVSGAGVAAIYDDANGPGGVVVSGNNASGSATALDLESSAFGSWVTGNDLCGSGSVDLVSDLLASFAGNDLLGDGSVQFLGDTIGAFDHNDLNSSSFVQSGTTIAGTWNLAYPIGGNYWTGYAGADAFSGAGQDVPGGDGIGDTPYSLAGATDAYPLMGPWIAASITFAETGLPANATWTVTLNGVGVTAMAGTSIAFPQVNGADTAFSYRVDRSDLNYVTSGGSGSGTEDGTDQVVRVAFTPRLNAVTFQESGLPGGTSWEVDLGSTAQTSTTATIVFEVVNGTYAYSVPSLGTYSATPDAGNVTVAGVGPTTTLTFAAGPYALTFEVAGLPSGTSWSANVSGQNQSTTGARLVFPAANGSVAFTAAASNGFVLTPASGSVTIEGANTTVYLAATASGTSSFALAFLQTGLPSGSSWSVSVNGGAAQTSTGASLTFGERSGSYAFTVTVPSGFTVTPSSGTVAVSGGNATVYLVIASATSPGASGTSSVGPGELYGLAAGLAGVAIVALIGGLLYLRGRSKRGGGGTRVLTPSSAPPGGPARGPPAPSDGGPGGGTTPKGP